MPDHWFSPKPKPRPPIIEGLQTRDGYTYRHLDDKGRLSAFHHDPKHIELHFFRDGEIVTVTTSELESESPDCWWSWLSYEDGRFHHTASHILGVQLCSGTFFRREIEEGLGRLVPVTVAVTGVYTPEQDKHKGKS